MQSGAVVKKCYLTANSKIVAGGRVMKVKCGRFVLGWPFAGLDGLEGCPAIGCR
jgi:hypothetical protein